LAARTVCGTSRLGHQSQYLLVEPVNNTLKGQLDLEDHGGRALDGAAS
jgi:hypothetical protein